MALDLDKFAENFGRELDSWARDNGIAPAPRNSAEFHDVASSDAVKMGLIFNEYPTSAGAIVNERTAMLVSAAFACTRLITGAIASLPLPVYERTDKGRVRVEHDYWWLLNEQPTPRFTAASFWKFGVGQLLLRGDGLAYIERNRIGTPIGFIPLKRSQVEIRRVGKRLRYYIQDVNDDGELVYFGCDQEDMLHFPGAGFDGTCGMSVIRYAARQAIGIALKGDEFAGTFFGNGAHPQYAVKWKGTMTEEQQKLFRESWVAKYGSGQGVSKIPLILTEDGSVEQLSLSAEDAQLLQGRQFQVEEIARAFGVPPFMIGHTQNTTSWGSGVEAMGIGFVKYTLRDHLCGMEQELNRKLWPRRERFFVEFNVDGLQEGDSKSQAEYFGKSLGGPGAQGWMTVNEVRRLKNLPPIEGGDVIYKPTAKPGATDEPKPAQ